MVEPVETQAPSRHDGFVAADDFEQAASQLYAAAREDFIPLRKRLAKDARAAGDKALAEQIEKLAKPTTAAWLANGLARTQAETVQELVQLGDLMRDATERMAGDELRTLSQRRPQLIRSLIKEAAAESGQPHSDAVSRELDELLTAAVTDVDTGKALLVGRLTSAREAAPLGAWPQVLPGAAAARDRSRVQPAARTAARDDRSVSAERPRKRSLDQRGGGAVERGADERSVADPSGNHSQEADRDDAELAAARHVLEQARHAVKEAEAARGERERELHDGEQAAAAASAEVLRLTELLDAAEAYEREARKRVVTARRAAKDAEREASQAWRDVQLAERRLSDLQGIADS